MENLSKSIEIELKNAENLKPEIRKQYNLKEKGIVIKKITRSSAANFNYEYVGSVTEFLKRIEILSKKIDVRKLVERLKSSL